MRQSDAVFFFKVPISDGVLPPTNRSPCSDSPPWSDLEELFMRVNWASVFSGLSVWFIMSAPACISGKIHGVILFCF